MVTLPPPTPPQPSLATSQPTTPSASAPHKPPTTRVAVARAMVRFSNPTAARLIRGAAMKKGDVLSVARIAGIMAAKRTADLIPLCHNIPIGGVAVDVEVVGGGGDGGGDEEGETRVDGVEWKAEDPGEFGGVVITARVHTFGQTGVEMEALTAASVAGLTVYDMCKAVDKGMVLEAVRVVLKEGGRSGDWRERS